MGLLVAHYVYIVYLYGMEWGCLSIRLVGNGVWITCAKRGDNLSTGCGKAVDNCIVPPLLGTASIHIVLSGQQFFLKWGL